jgi:hypothetical protein
MDKLAYVDGYRMNKVAARGEALLASIGTKGRNIANRKGYSFSKNAKSSVLKTPTDYSLYKKLITTGFPALSLEKSKAKSESLKTPNINTEYKKLITTGILPDEVEKKEIPIEEDNAVIQWIKANPEQAAVLAGIVGGGGIGGGIGGARAKKGSKIKGTATGAGFGASAGGALGLILHKMLNR